MKMSRKLRVLMKATGLTPTTLAAAAGCSASFINQLLYDGQKTLPPGLAQRLSLALDVPVEDLR